MKHLTYFALAALMVSSATAQTVKIPKAPTALCLEDDPSKCPQDLPPASGVKWNPGHYMQVLRGTADTVQSTRFGYYDQIAGNRDVAGVGVFYRWSQLEGARGDYSAGIKLIRAEVAKLKSLSVPKRLAIRILDANYGTTLPASNFYPAYVAASGKLLQTPKQVVWRKWDAEAMGWFIDMLSAYAAAFDGDPYVEIISPMHETALAWHGMTPPSDYTESKLDTQYRRLATELKKSWARTNVWIPTNWGLNESRMQAYIQYLATIGVGAGNVDVCPTCNMYVDRIMRGVSLPNFMSVEASEMGYNSVGPAGGFTAKQIYDYANGVQRVSHLFWDRNMSVGTVDQRWDTGILPVIHQSSLVATSYPIVYGQLTAAN